MVPLLTAAAVEGDGWLRTGVQEGTSGSFDIALELSNCWMSGLKRVRVVEAQYIKPVTNEYSHVSSCPSDCARGVLVGQVPLPALRSIA